MEFKCRLKVIFAERNIKHKDFAEKIGISRTTLSLLVREKSVPRFDVAYRIAKALEMPIESIWTEK